jgi:Arc/MetJ-type ribon-helix-helix transcriptional regulator
LSISQIVLYHYKNRSEAIRDLIRKKLVDKLIDIQHDKTFKTKNNKIPSLNQRLKLGIFKNNLFSPAKF